jgi:hypothetical protein
MDRHEQDTEDQERSRHGTGDRLIDAMAAVPRGGSGAQEEDEKTPRTDWLCMQLATVAMNPAVHDHLPGGLLEAVQAWLRAAPVVSDPPKDEKPLPSGRNEERHVVCPVCDRGFCFNFQTRTVTCGCAAKG